MLFHGVGTVRYNGTQIRPVIHYYPYRPGRCRNRLRKARVACAISPYELGGPCTYEAAEALEPLSWSHLIEHEAQANGKSRSGFEENVACFIISSFVTSTPNEEKEKVWNRLPHSWLAFAAVSQ